MVYLIIKELSPSADKVIIVTSSLMKDMNSKTDMYRGNAIRVLCRITDGTLLTQIERLLKQAIVDKNPVVASAALVSGIHLLQRENDAKHLRNKSFPYFNSWIHIFVRIELQWNLLKGLLM